MFFLIGQTIINFFFQLGQITLLTLQIFKKILTGKIHVRNTIEQLILLGMKSFPIVFVAATFIGMVFALQLIHEFLKFGAAKMIGGVMGLALWRELSPLLTGMVIAGRVGAAIAAELGSMKVTEQMDALKALSQDVIEFLVVPRVIACLIMVPLLVGIADIIGFFSGFCIALASGRVNPYAYMDSAQTMLIPIDIWGGLIKGIFFGLVIAVVGCYVGLTTKDGAKGVGEATTKAVVVSIITIFILNYFLSMMIF
jgi:phospholipid/cholesterol/gamma-HCH transport system permease protein